MLNNNLYHMIPKYPLGLLCDCQVGRKFGPLSETQPGVWQQGSYPWMHFHRHGHRFSRLCSVCKYVLQQRSSGRLGVAPPPPLGKHSEYAHGLNGLNVRR